MKGPLFYSKILLFGEYGIIKDSEGLSIRRKPDRTSGGGSSPRANSAVTDNPRLSPSRRQSVAYKDVNLVVDVVHKANLATKVARMRPIGVIKG